MNGVLTVRDRGPNWIHGTEKNPIADISALSKSITHSWEGGQAIIDRNGHPVDKKMATKAIDFMWMTIDRAYKYSRTNIDTIPSSKSLWDFFVEELEKTGASQAEKEACLELSKLWGAYIGAPINRQSLKFFFLEECIDGSTYRICTAGIYVLRLLAFSESIRGLHVQEHPEPRRETGPRGR